MTTREAREQRAQDRREIREAMAGMRSGDRIVLKGKHRDAFWEEMVEELFDLDGLFYELSWRTEGLGDMVAFVVPPEPGDPPKPDPIQEAAEGAEKSKRRLLKWMERARPEAAREVRERWEASWPETIRGLGRRRRR